MNIINKLTIRHLKENKRRSLVTIIGVIISVAMITAVATLGVSFLDLLKRQEIASNGEWHVQYHGLDADQVTAIEKDSDTKKLALSSNGYAHLEGSKNESKPYVFFQNYNAVGMTQFPIEISEGRLPLNDAEIAISEEITKNAGVDFKIGDEITFEIGERWAENEDRPLYQNYPLQYGENGVIEEINVKTTKTLKVVGKIKRPDWENAWAPGYTVIGYVDKNSIADTNKVNAFVVLNKVKGSLYKHSEELVEAHDISNVSYNTELLRYYGVTKNDNLRATLYSLAGIIMGVIIIGSVALIYNAFAISVSERARHLGMLSSVGATKKQKRNSVFFEGAVIGAISIPIGIIAGLAGIGITFAFINKYLQGALNVSVNLELVVTLGSILVACGISMITIFISTYIPAQKASKISAIDAIRQTQDIKLSRKAVKTSKSIRKIFGLEAEIGLKNVKRNKKRYIATVFSLVVSIVLFLTVSYFTDNLKKSLELTQDEISYDIQITGNHLDKEELKTYTKLDHVTKSSIIEEVNLEALIDQEDIPEQLKEYVREDDSILQDGKYPYYSSLISLDKDSFEEYAKQVGVDTQDFVNQEIPTAIIIDQIKYEDYETHRIVETKSIHSEVGKVIDLFTMFFGEEDEPEREFLNKIKIGALTDKIPMGVNTGGQGNLTMIISEETMEQLIDDDNELSHYVYLNSSDPLATQEAIEEIKESNVYVYNVFQRRQEQEQMITLMSVFTYGFITLISLISIANIFNTISTSISLRKREFAMLRSVGMTPKGFNKMINYESIFYGVKSLLYGLPISVAVMFGIHKSLGNTFEYGFTLPWMSILFVIVIIFIIVGSAMVYSISKIKKENIIDGLKQENI